MGDYAQLDPLLRDRGSVDRVVAWEGQQAVGRALGSAQAFSYPYRKNEHNIGGMFGTA